MMLIEEPDVMVLCKTEESGIETAAFNIHGARHPAMHPLVCRTLGIGFHREIQDRQTVGKVVEDSLDRFAVSFQKDRSQCVATVDDTLKGTLKTQYVNGRA
jgi:hypothetical protein